MKNKNFRYKGSKAKEFGVNTNFFRTIVTNIEWYCESALKLPKPRNQAEISMLSKFIFGVELTCEFEHFNDSLADMTKPKKWGVSSEEQLRNNRFVKLYKLNPNKKDVLVKSDVPDDGYRSYSERKFVFANFRYLCNQRHGDYYDSDFNHEIFNTDYEIDSCFWTHCVGRLYCGGIGGVSYGQVDITSYKESERIINIYNNPNEPVRKSFKRKIDRLIIKDKKHDEEVLESKV